MAVNPRPNFDLSQFTTFGIGGRARWVVEIHSVSQVEAAWHWADKRGLRILVAGEGSNILVSDRGFEGLLLINRIDGVHIVEPSSHIRNSSGPAVQAFSSNPTQPSVSIRAGGGINLMELIRWCNARHLSGMEKMYGIPGSLAGAVVGNAGAYGQEIQDTVVEATVLGPAGTQVLGRAELGFRYRHSTLKENRAWFLVDCLLQLWQSNEDLQRTSEEILRMRTVKYPPGLKCPGSFFKNVEVATLPANVLDRVPPDFVFHGKVPAGRLLQAVGACGARSGGAMIASHHGNLFINTGGATSQDVLNLAAEYARKVYEKFAIRLEPEVLIVDGADDILMQGPAIDH